MRAKGLTGDSNATSVLFTSALNYKIDMSKYLDSATKVVLDKGERIDMDCSEDRGYFYYYVIYGAIDMYVSSPGNVDTHLYNRGEGNVFTGEMNASIPSNTTRCWALAMTDAKLAAFTYAQFKDMVQHDDAFLHDYLYMAQLSCDQLIQRIDNVYEKSGSRRMLLWLSKLCEVSTPDDQGVYRIECPLSIDDLSSLLDIHYATCVKLLRALKKRGIIERTPSQMIIKNAGSLSALLDEENPVLY